MTNPTTSPAERVDCDDSSLVALARAGNMPAIDRLVHRYRPEAYRAAARVVRCHEDAEEVAQDALWAAINHLSTFRQDASFRTWLHRIVVNRSLMVLRRRQSKGLAEPFPTGCETLPSINGPRTPEQLLLETERRTAVNEALRRLPDSYSLVLLFASEGRSATEIAECVGSSAGAVKARLHRGRARLRREIDHCMRVKGALRTIPRGQAQARRDAPGSMLAA